MRSLSSSKTAVLKSTAVLRRLADGPASSGSGGGDRRSLSQEPDYRAGGDTAIGALDIEVRSRSRPEVSVNASDDGAMQPAVRLNANYAPGEPPSW
jgi:hypothetical protein